MSSNDVVATRCRLLQEFGLCPNIISDYVDFEDSTSQHSPSGDGISVDISCSPMKAFLPIKRHLSDLQDILMTISLVCENANVFITVMTAVTANLICSHTDHIVVSQETRELMNDLTKQSVANNSKEILYYSQNQAINSELGHPLSVEESVPSQDGDSPKFLSVLPIRVYDVNLGCIVVDYTKPRGFKFIGQEMLILQQFMKLINGDLLRFNQIYIERQVARSNNDIYFNEDDSLYTRDDHHSISLATIHHLRTNTCTLSLALSMLESNCTGDGMTDDILSPLHTALESCRHLEVAMTKEIFQPTKENQRRFSRTPTSDVTVMEPISEKSTDESTNSKKNPVEVENPETTECKLNIRSSLRDSMIECNSLLPEVTTSSRKSGKLRVLLVDDVVLLQKIIGKSLQRLGCDHDVAENGKKALELLMKSHYDLVITDFVMPIMSGIELLKSYSKWFYSKGIRASYPYIIGMSATADEGEQHEAYEAGMNLFFLKPINSTSLSNIINTLQSDKINRENEKSKKNMNYVNIF